MSTVDEKMQAVTEERMQQKQIVEIIFVKSIWKVKMVAPMQDRKIVNQSINQKSKAYDEKEKSKLVDNNILKYKRLKYLKR